MGDVVDTALQSVAIKKEKKRRVVKAEKKAEKKVVRGTQAATDLAQRRQRSADITRRRRQAGAPAAPQAVGTRILTGTLGDTSAAAIGTKTLVGG